MSGDSSITGADHVVIVTEPTRSGLHDMERALTLVQGFDIPVSAVINKVDIDPETEMRVRRLCLETGTILLGTIPYDTTVTQAMVQGCTVFEMGNGSAAGSIRKIWEKLVSEL